MYRVRNAWRNMCIGSHDVKNVFSTVALSFILVVHSYHVLSTDYSRHYAQVWLSGSAFGSLPTNYSKHRELGFDYCPHSPFGSIIKNIPYHHLVCEDCIDRFYLFILKLVIICLHM